MTVQHIVTNRINQPCLSHTISPKDGLIQQFYSARTLLIDCQSPLQRSITSNLKFILILKFCENLPHVDHGFGFYVMFLRCCCYVLISINIINCLEYAQQNFIIKPKGYYTPGIYADGYIAFAFPFVRSYVS